MKKVVIGLSFILMISLLWAVLWLNSQNDYQLDGEIVISALDEAVTVHRDRAGIPYIFAKSLADGIRAQGFVMAQDRVFQVELYRAIIRGNLASIIGEAGVESDIKMRLLGIFDNAKRHAQYLDESSREFLQWYADGYNEFILNRTSEYPLEVDLLGIQLSTITIEELLAVQHYAGFIQGRNYEDEILALQLAAELGEKALRIKPLNINPDRRSPVAIQTSSKSNFAAQLSYKGDERSLPVSLPTLGSNNWVTGSTKSENGKPILTNDPHLDASILPGPWYPVGLFAPNIRAVGASLPGVPGIMVGRNQDIAFGVTNAYGDSQDLFVESIDPNNPNHYLEDEKSLPFQLDRQTFKVKDKEIDKGYRTIELRIRRTNRGPVISDHKIFGLEDGLVVSFRTAAAELQSSSLGFRDLLLAQNIDDADRALSKVDVLYMNYLFADKEGGIAHRPTGAIPIRLDGSEAQAVTGIDNWQGFIPKADMPASARPSKDWLATSNHDVVPDNYSYFYSTHFSPIYRYLRTSEWMQESKTKSAEDHWKLVVDNKNLHAKRLVPIFLKALNQYDGVDELKKQLGEWDYKDHVSSTGATVFHLMHEYLIRSMLDGKMTPELTKKFLSKRYYWLQRFDELIERNDPYWGDIPTSELRESIKTLIQSAAEQTKVRLETTMGSSPESWVWGDFHKVSFVSPLKQNGFASGFLGGGVHPANGSGETLNRGQYSLNEGPYRSQWFSSMRMVADLSDDKKIMANISGGNSARQFHPYFKSQLDEWLEERWIPWWLDKESIETNSERQLQLKPN